MHRLQRPSGPPELAEAPARGASHWNDLEPHERAAIRRALKAMQEDRCAYCEGILKDRCHIDHFRKRSDFPRRTFDWANLYLSCNVPHHCAHHKDNLHGDDAPRYDDLIDPCRDDPEDFLVFLSDGSITPREHLGDNERRRAIETIRVFQLNHPALVFARRNIVRQLRSSVSAVPGNRAPSSSPRSNDQPDPTVLEIRAYFEQECPHATACYHALGIRRNAPNSTA